MNDVNAQKPNTFLIDDREVDIRPGETIFNAARRLGIELPHLCYSPKPGYRPDGNCRVCMVEIEGERVLAASCIRNPAPGMKVKTSTDRAKTARKMVAELLLTDQPAREIAHDPDSEFWKVASRMELKQGRFPRRATPAPDRSHVAMAVNLDACIQCNLCVRACREVQVNDVIGMAGRGFGEKIVFDFDDPMGNSTCVACGECVQACPTGALMPATMVDDNNVYKGKPDRTVDSVCPYCGVGCQLTYQIKDDKIVAVAGRDGPANQNRLCVKGRFGFDYVHNPQRLLKPMIRKEGVAKVPHEEIDPSNPWTHFREATWDEALDRAASGLKKIRDRDGPQALAGFGSAKGSNEEAYLFQKLVRTGFGTNNVDHCTRLCHASSVAALLEDVGSGAVSNQVEDVALADVAIVIGANPTVNHPVAATFMKNAAKNGTKIILMDPRRSDLARHATYFLQFNGDTDVALLNGLLHVIVEEGLANEDFIRTRTENYEALKANLVEYTPEKVAPITGISAQTIREVARLYATAKASIIFWGMGISQHVHGTDNARCLISLALLTGQIGRPGTGLHPLRGQNNVQGASDAGLIPMFYPDYQPVDRPAVRERFEAAWGRPLDPKRGLTVTEIVGAALTGGVRGMYMLGENPFLSDPNINKVRKALSALEFLVVQDIFLTETAEFADVILPASSYLEKSGTYTNTDRRVQLGRKVLDTPGQARVDWEVVQDVANRIGLDWHYETSRDIFEEMVSVIPSYQNLSYDNLGLTGKLYPNPDPEHSDGTVVMFTEKFNTNDGLAHLVPAEWLPARELPSEEYPFVLNTGRMLEHWHTGSMTRRSYALDAISPKALVFIHPDDAAELALEDGDLARVSSRRGVIELEAKVSHREASGNCFIPFHFREAAANLLTTDEIDPIGKIPEFKFCAVRIEPARIEKADG